jgi:hypothetical protein
MLAAIGQLSGQRRTTGVPRVMGAAASASLVVEQASQLPADRERKRRLESPQDLQ